MNPYPQLCPHHMADMAMSLRELEDLADALGDAFTAIMVPAYDDRLTAVLVAAADLDLPGLHYVKTKRIEEFLRRIEATVAKGDDFARIVEAWWNHRQAKVDAEKLALQIAWHPVGVEVRRDRQA
jgi:hypothetical protein